MNRNVYTLLFDNRIGLEKSDTDLEKELIQTVLNALRIKKGSSKGAFKFVPYTTKALLYTPNLFETSTIGFLKKEHVLGKKGSNTSINDPNATVVIRINHSISAPHRNASV